MADKSSYLRYLPPVLWENEPDDPDFSLGALLRIFEKVLTGIDDGAQIGHGDHTHDAITAQIARLYELFDPWRTPPESLAWLASWVALDFPTLRGQPIWDEYQQRKLISEATRIYRQRGLRTGLNRSLSLYSVGQTRARVAIDDGSRLLITRPEPGRVAQVGTFVAQGALLGGGPVLRVLSEGLIRPWCIIPLPGGHFLVGDAGVPSDVSPQPNGPVWRISAGGQYYDFAGRPPEPLPFMAPALPLTRVAALALRIEGTTQVQVVYVLYLNGDLYRIQGLGPNVPATRVLNLATGGTAFRPVAMAVDVNNDLLILDRGDGFGTSNPPEIISVGPQSSPVVTRRSLATVVEPLSLLVLPNGQLLIGDGREQEPQTPAQFPGNLVRVNRSNAAAWTETLLLSSPNPLVAPTAIVQDDATHVYVLDAGLKPFTPPGDPFVLAVAEPATVYRVDLAANPPTAVRAAENGQLVFPTGMAASGGHLVICDPGQPEVFGVTPVWPRLLPYRFGVVIHFTDSGLPGDPGQRASVQRQVVGNIRDIVDQQKPAHTVRTLITAIP